MASKAAERKFSSPARLPSADNLKIDSDSDSDEDDKVLTGQTWADFTKEEEIPDKKIGDYLIGGSLGRGAQGKVYKGLNMKTGKFVAIKEFPIRDEEDKISVQVQKISEEISILSKLKHKNIVKYISLQHNSNFMYVVYEFIENGSLKDVIYKFGNFPESLSAVYIKQILEALEYLHEKDIVHRDIKGGNILITKDGICKLADFGLAVRTNKTTEEGPAGTTYWMAPELFSEGTVEVGTPADIWSLGATLVEIITGMPPFQNLGPLGAVFQLVDGNLSPIPIGVSDPLQAFLERCFDRNPKTRATAKELLQHSWITGKSTDKTAINSSGNFTNLIAALKDYRLSGKNKSIGFNQKKASTRRTSLKTIHANLQAASFQNTNSAISDSLSAILATSNSKTVTEACDTLTKSIKTIVDTSLQTKNELQLANKEIDDLTTQWKNSMEETETLRRQFHALREKFQFLEANIGMTDMQFAKLIYGNSLQMESFPESTKRGVLKIATKKPTGTRWSKRAIALRDNFLFLYKPTALLEPVEVVRLNDVMISTDHRKLPPNSFIIDTRGRQILFCAANPTILTAWMQALSFPASWYDDSTPNEFSTQFSNKAQDTEAKLKTVRKMARSIRRYSIAGNS